MKKNILFLLLCFLMFNFTFASNKIIGTINGENIYDNDINEKVKLNYYNTILNEIINEKLILQEAKKNKIKEEEKEVQEIFNKTISNFKNKEDFYNFLKTLNTNEKRYKELIAEQIKIEKTIIKLKNINIKDEDVKKYYEENKKNFLVPESVKLSQITVKTEQEANDLYLALQAGASFEKLAENKNLDENLKTNKGDIGYISKGILNPEIENKIFSAKKGEIVKPIFLNGYYTILKIEDIKPSKILSYEEVKKELKNFILNQLISTKKKELINELRQKSKIEIK